jgi:hypothetical protein
VWKLVSFPDYELLNSSPIFDGTRSRCDKVEPRIKIQIQETTGVAVVATSTWLDSKIRSWRIFRNGNIFYCEMYIHPHTCGSKCGTTWRIFRNVLQLLEKCVPARLQASKPSKWKNLWIHQPHVSVLSFCCLGSFKTSAMMLNPSKHDSAVRVRKSRSCIRDR